MYEPTTEAELAVHVKKVDDVRRWLSEAFDGGPSGKLTRYRRILVLTGPAGTGKTTTIRILSREMGFEILEWRTGIGEATSSNFNDTGAASSSSPGHYDLDYESPFAKFETFLNRAANCQNIFSASNSSNSKQNLNLPNILHSGTQAQFHTALYAFVNSAPAVPAVPLVIIVSDAGRRGEEGDERLASGMWGKDKNQAVDVRTVLSKELLQGPYVTQVAFNPVAPTILRKAIQALLDRHFSSSSCTQSAPPSKEVLDAIIETSNGDIRSAIMTLQFACVIEMQPKGRRKKGGTKKVMEAITQREQSLALFHLLGRVFYNKRKGDPPSASASAKDIQREREIDEKLKEQPKLPPHLQQFTRRTSRVNVDTMYADSPIDSSLFSLYLHQNYPQFCDDMEHCEGVADCLSWVDSSGGESWFQTNPHQFHILAMGTLQALPTPMPRRGQKVFRPEYFDVLQKEKDAWDGVRDVRGWLVDSALRKEGSHWRAGGWSRMDVVTELGAVLKAKDNDKSLALASKPPFTNQLFSRMAFSNGIGDQGQQIYENDNNFDPGAAPGEEATFGAVKDDDDRNGGWLETDDIEDFA
ncbi:Rad17 cell cycle checkpoint protein-domain-containing protein [Cyathus striatus]|nr:Rad17 cell cycle checkpoint protein-domain-containing protein [Cyathus striatus]